MSAVRYKRALRILERWPTDPSKGEHRDLGVLLRKKIGESFKKGEQSEISEPEKCDRMLTSLENISLDKHRKEYQFNPPLSIGALLNDFETCHSAVSAEGMNHFKGEGSKGVMKRTYEKIFGTKTGESDEKKTAT